MALDLGTTLLTVAASYEAIAKAENAIGKYQKKISDVKKAADKTEGAQQRLNDAFSGLTKTAQLVLGPLSGIASRLGNIQSILSSGTTAVAAFTAGVSALIATTASAAGLFRQVEVDLLGIQSVLKATGKATDTSVNQIIGAVERFSSRSATPLQDSIKAAQAAITFKGVDLSNLEEFLIAAGGMSQAYGDSILSASIAIGKAIESPSAALEAMAEKGLARFTTEQKKQMQAWADAGEHAKVYSAIMEQVLKKVGDAGDATGSYAVTLNKLSIAWFKFRMRIFQGSEAAGAMEGVIEKVTRKLQEWTKAGSVADQVGIIIEKTANGVGAALDFMGKHMDKIVLAFKVWASTQVVGMAVKGVLTFEAALISSAKAVSGLGKVFKLGGNLFKTLENVSGVITPLKVLLKLFAPLKGIVIILSGLAGAFTAFGAANVNTGNAILDVWVSVLAFWQTLKSRLAAGWDFLSKNVKILADNVSTKFNEMFPNFDEELKEIRDFSTNMANLILRGVSVAVTASIALFDNLIAKAKGFFGKMELETELKNLGKLRDEILAKGVGPDEDVFLKIGSGRSAKTLKGNLTDTAKRISAIQDELELLDANPVEAVAITIQRALANMTDTTIDQIGGDLIEMGKRVGEATRITPLIEFTSEAVSNFTEDFEKDLRELEAKYKIKIPIDPETQWDKFFAAANEEVEPKLSELARKIKDQLKDDLEDLGASVAQALAHQLISGEKVDWSKIGQTIGEQVAEGLIQKLIVDKAVTNLQNGVESIFKTGLNLLSNNNTNVVGIASQALGSPGNSAPVGSTLFPSSGPNFNPATQSPIVNNFNITTPNPETFRQARGRVIGSMQSGLANR